MMNCQNALLRVNSENLGHAEDEISFEPPKAENDLKSAEEAKEGMRLEF